MNDSEAEVSTLKLRRKMHKSNLLRKLQLGARRRCDRCYLLFDPDRLEEYEGEWLCLRCLAITLNI